MSGEEDRGHPFPLGRHVQHDERSRGFPAPVSGDLRTVSHRHSGPVLDQGDVGSCTGNALAQALNTKPLRHNGARLLDERDAVRIYSEATRVDNVPGEYNADGTGQDTGSTGLAVCKAAKAEGLIDGYTHAFGLDHLLGALMLQPVIIGIAWHDTMFTPDAAGYLHPEGRIAGGHEVALIGLNTVRERVTVLNSWGAGWGRHGRAYLAWEDLDALLADGGDCTVPLKVSA